MAFEDTDKALVASSEFDPSAFIKGIDQMTASLTRLSVEEDKLRANIATINNSLKANRAEYKANADQIKALDTNSKTYTADLAQLNTQQKTLQSQQKELRANLVTQKDALAAVTKQATDYKNALTGLQATSKQLADQNKGRTLFDVASLNQQVVQITQAGARLRNVFQGRISTAELDKFEAALADTKDEMTQLAQVVAFVKSKLDTLDPDSQEFQDLTNIVRAGEEVLEQYGNTAEETGNKQVSLRTQLRQTREELARLEEQGKDNTEEFETLAIQAGRLQDQMQDTQQRIKVLASDTRNLDFGIGAIRGAAAAFGVAEGSAALFGLKSEDVAASLQRLNAIMLVLNGLQEIQTLLQKQSVVAIVGQSIATKGAAIAQGIFATVVGTSTGALRAFRVALLATGIGAFIVLLGFAANAMGAFSSETEDATDINKLYNDSLELSNLLLDSRVRSLKNNTAAEEEKLKRTLGFIPNQEPSIKAQEALDQKLFEVRQKAGIREKELIRAQLAELRIQQDDFIASGKTGDFLEKSNADAIKLGERLIAIDDQITGDKEKNLTKQFQDGQKAREREYNATVAFLERLTTLQRTLRDKQLQAQPQDEDNLRKSFANSLSDALADLDKEVKAGKITQQRALILKTVVEQISNVDLTEAIKDFKREAEEAETDLANTIFDLRLKNGEERANLIRDQFTREAALVRIEARSQGNQLKRERDDLIKSINDTRDEGLISPETAQQNIERVEVIYSQLLENLAAQTTRKQEEISARVFEAAQEQVERIFTGATLIVSQATTGEIQKLSARYQAGKISYEEFQKELTRITTEESTRRIAQNIREQEELLKNAQAQLKVENDPERQKALQDRIVALQIQIDALKRQLEIADAAGEAADDADRNGRIQELAKYAQAIGGIINQVVQFWQQANEAEARALQRSIDLQETRVEAAIRIAERGNSEYLRLEEDRLQELQLKQEEAARRQLAINAILQTSQALVAFTTALAQGISTTGPLGGIAIAGAVIAAISAGYAIVSSLTNDGAQKLKKGTKRVERGPGDPAGVDTIDAKLTAGEAVLPVDVNRQYKPTVEAIFDKQIPADVINNFVNNYPKKEISTMVNNYRTVNRILPQLDHERMTEAAGIVIAYDSELLNATRQQTRKISEHSALLEQLDRRLSQMGINVTLDKNGLALSVLKATEQFAIDKKS